jgi:UDP-3-O-acyl N-acetylglucosamine deacetylase
VPSRRTIAREVALEGEGLHEGRRARLALAPAEAGSGVRFRRADLPGTAPVPADVAVSSGEMRRTAVRGEDGAEVHTIEHLMAALHGRGITDLLCTIDAVEVPGMDGSALAFDEAIAGAGLRELPGEPPALVLDRVVEVEGAGGARIVALPAPGRLVVGYALDYSEIPGLEAPLRQSVEVEVTPESFRRELAPARTFAFEEEALLLRSMGFGKGASTRNTLVIRADGTPLENALRFPDEYARHKALDLLGDLALLGLRLEARVLAYKAGHALNGEMCRALRRVAEEIAARGRDGAAAATVAGPGTEGEAERAGGSARAGGAGALASLRAAETFTPGPEAFLGHFPGDPVLPGVATLAAARGGADAAGVAGVKFRRVVRPGEALAIERSASGDGGVRARALACGEPALDAFLEPRSRGQGS